MYQAQLSSRTFYLPMLGEQSKQDVSSEHLVVKRRERELIEDRRAHYRDEHLDLVHMIKATGPATYLQEYLRHRGLDGILSCQLDINTFYWDTAYREVLCDQVGAHQGRTRRPGTLGWRLGE